MGNDNGSLSNIGWIGKFGDLVNRIVGSNSKIGNFTILKFLFSHNREKKLAVNLRSYQSTSAFAE